jgi:hypothetical protein
VCGGKGTCLLKEGLCVCYTGFAGTACEACAAGYTFYAGNCLPVAATRQEGNSTDALAPASVVSDAASDDGMPKWSYAIIAAGILLIIVAVVVTVCCCVCARARARAVPEPIPAGNSHSRAVQPPQLSSAAAATRSGAVGADAADAAAAHAALVGMPQHSNWVGSADGQDGHVK